MNAQVPVADSNAVRILPASDTINKVGERDIVDVFRKWFRLKPSTKSDYMKPGDKPVMSILPAIGYTLQTRLAAVLSGNMAFITNSKPGAKLSVANINVIYTQNKQLTVPFLSNIWLKGDEYNLRGDWRYMKYPQSTFGLGSDSRLSMEDPLSYHYIRIYQYLLKKLANDFYAGIGYTLDHYWNVTEKGAFNGMVSEYAEYGASRKATSSGPAVQVLYDNRKNPINPSQGLFASVIVRDNVKWMGSDNQWKSAVIDVRKYIGFPGHSKNILAFWSYNWLILDGKPPYLDLPSTGWDNYNNTGRGFIQGRFRGNIMLYLESEYRFRITHDGVLGAVLFSSAESFSGAPSRKLESIQPAVGGGMRIRLNKKSNTNIAIDYGFGTQGMKGLFVNVGEVF
jgi:hypothetical protein